MCYLWYFLRKTVLPLTFWVLPFQGFFKKCYLFMVLFNKYHLHRACTGHSHFTPIYPSILMSRYICPSYSAIVWSTADKKRKKKNKNQFYLVLQQNKQNINRNSLKTCDIHFTLHSLYEFYIRKPFMFGINFF